METEKEIDYRSEIAESRGWSSFGAYYPKLTCRICGKDISLDGTRLDRGRLHVVSCINACIQAMKAHR